MELHLESGHVILGATVDDIFAHIDGEEFAILSASADTYIQCARQNDPPYEYLLEYQNGSLDEHYVAADEQITLVQVQFAFVKYLRGDPAWHSDFLWEKMDLT